MLNVQIQEFSGPRKTVFFKKNTIQNIISIIYTCTYYKCIYREKLIYMHTTWRKYIASKMGFEPKFFAVSELVRAAGISSLQKTPSS